MFDFDMDLEEVGDLVLGGVEDESGGSLRVGVLGSGQCGGKLAEAFYELGYRKCLSLNTTESDVNGVPNKVLLSVQGKQGGAGKDLALAGRALAANATLVTRELGRVFGVVDHVLICVGLGGGSGSGSVLGLVELCKRYLVHLGLEDVERRVSVVVTLPTIGESQNSVVGRNVKAVLGELNRMSREGKLGGLMVVDNERLKRMYSKLPLAKFYPTINGAVAKVFDVFNSLSNTASSYMTVDGRDFQSMLQAGGNMAFGVCPVMDVSSRSGFDKLPEEMVKRLLASGYDLTSAKVACCIFVAPKQVLEEVGGLMDSFEYGFDLMCGLLGGANVHRGIYEDATADKVRMYLCVGGMEKPEAVLRFG